MNQVGAVFENGKIADEARAERTLIDPKTMEVTEV
jgi:hypothetical protein